MPEQITIIDTRDPSEFAESHVDGAINIPPEKFVDGRFQEELKDVLRDSKVILYCRSGARSNTCSMFMEQAGFTNVINGINEHHVRKLIA